MRKPNIKIDQIWRFKRSTIKKLVKELSSSLVDYQLDALERIADDFRAKVIGYNKKEDIVTLSIFNEDGTEFEKSFYLKNFIEECEPDSQFG